MTPRDPWNFRNFQIPRKLKNPDFYQYYSDNPLTEFNYSDSLWPSKSQRKLKTKNFAEYKEQNPRTWRFFKWIYIADMQIQAFIQRSFSKMPSEFIAVKKMKNPKHPDTRIPSHPPELGFTRCTKKKIRKLNIVIAKFLIIVFWNVYLFDGSRA